MFAHTASILKRKVENDLQAYIQTKETNPFVSERTALREQAATSLLQLSVVEHETGSVSGASALDQLPESV